MHGINGMMLIPLIALLLLIVSFFAKVPRAASSLAVGPASCWWCCRSRWASPGTSIPCVGVLHGINALADLRRRAPCRPLASHAEVIVDEEARGGHAA